MLWRAVTFDADAEPAFDAAWAVDQDKEQRLDDEIKLWFNERVAGGDREEQILEQGGGGGNGGGGTMRLRWIEVPLILDIENSRE